MAEKGRRLDPDDPDTLFVLGAIRLMQRRFEEPEKLCLESVARGPNVADCHAWLATVYNYTDRPEMALRTKQKAMCLSSSYPDMLRSFLAYNDAMNKERAERGSLKLRHFDFLGAEQTIDFGLTAYGQSIGEKVGASGC